ncbi:proline-specific permease [Penicillium odoratum]|uniref:proline-specific permease n=1 Tax=Penicillium odoratum TaxID=1167516 RepID=UPI002547034A|nr:proline-specific permease [Penicillium odoratum]KAJ5759044.1 proline-specific permease [Penicillium odoratum]
MSVSLELHDWPTERVATSSPTGVPCTVAGETATQEREQRPDLLTPASLRVVSNTRSASTEETLVNSDHDAGFRRRVGETIVVGPREDRTVNRKLKGIHLFMITINATLGIGLYWRGGQILELGGPLAVVLSYFLVGCLVWAIMQGITEMLCIWPIPGALSMYVSKFVDEELGIAVGIAYWFTYSMSFSTLLATLAAEFDYWNAFNSRGVHAGLIFAAVPITLVMINMLRIESIPNCFIKSYGLIEVITGSFKIFFMFVIFVFLIIINREDWSKPVTFDDTAAKNWPIALCNVNVFNSLIYHSMCISTAVFSFVGVEVVAASALEAKWPQHGRDAENSCSKASPKSPLVGSGVKFSAIYISVLATVAYTLSGFLVSLDIQSADCRLPRVTWDTTSTHCKDPGSQSAFVMIAKGSKIKHLADVINVFLVFTCLSCAGTNLYISSRALFGLTSQLKGGKGQSWHIRVLAKLGKTDHRKVPRRAIVFSAVAFCWIPFLQLIQGSEAQSSINVLIEVLSEMASVGLLIVWACVCLAFIRYHGCTQTIIKNQEFLDRDDVAQVVRNSRNYPYRSHSQPLLAWVAFVGCCTVLLVTNMASLWHRFHLLPFLTPFMSSYLTILVFIGMWVLLKVLRGAKWSLVDLSRAQRVAKILRGLHEMRAATMTDRTPSY